MRKQNIFDGDSYRAIFTGLIYKRLISRLWFTNADVMADAIGKPLICNVSDCDNYVELKKAFMTLRKRLGITVFQPRLKVCTFARTNYY